MKWLSQLSLIIKYEYCHLHCRQFESILFSCHNWCIFLTFPSEPDFLHTCHVWIWISTLSNAMLWVLKPVEMKTSQSICVFYTIYAIIHTKKADYMGFWILDTHSNTEQNTLPYPIIDQVWLHLERCYHTFLYACSIWVECIRVSMVYSVDFYRNGTTVKAIGATTMSLCWTSGNFNSIILSIPQSEMYMTTQRIHKIFKQASLIISPAGHSNEEEKKFVVLKSGIGDIHQLETVTEIVISMGALKIIGYFVFFATLKFPMTCTLSLY